YPCCIIGVKSKSFPAILKKIRKTHKKVTENGNFYVKPIFLYYCKLQLVTQKRIPVNK
ncbi:hypothetical protein FWK35_00038366, partial [Aphis craccivora]